MQISKNLNFLACFSLLLAGIEGKTVTQQISLTPPSTHDTELKVNSTQNTPLTPTQPTQLGSASDWIKRNAFGIGLCCAVCYCVAFFHEQRVEWVKEDLELERDCFRKERDKFEQERDASQRNLELVQRERDKVAQDQSRHVNVVAQDAGRRVNVLEREKHTLAQERDRVKLALQTCVKALAQVDPDHHLIAKLKETEGYEYLLEVKDEDIEEDKQRLERQFAMSSPNLGRAVVIIDVEELEHLATQTSGVGGQEESNKAIRTTVIERLKQTPKADGQAVADDLEKIIQQLSQNAWQPCMIIYIQAHSKKQYLTLVRTN